MLVKKVWVTLIRRGGGVGPVVRVVKTQALAHLLIEAEADACSASPDERGTDPATGHVVWFCTAAGEGQIEGPLDVEG